MLFDEDKSPRVFILLTLLSGITTIGLAPSLASCPTYRSLPERQPLPLYLAFTV